MSDDPATLNDAELAVLEPLGTRRRMRAGEYLYREGDVAYDFYGVLSGLVQITIRDDGEDRLINTHGAGRFLGELNLLTGSRVFLSARAVETGEVLAVPVEALRRVLAIQPQLSDKILAIFMARRNDLLRGAAAATRLVGSRYSPETLQLRETGPRREASPHPRVWPVERRAARFPLRGRCRSR